MNIKRIIREEIEGFLDSTEEDWEWTKGNPLEFTRGEVYIGVNDLNYRERSEVFAILEKELGELEVHEGSPDDSREERIDSCFRGQSIGILLHCGHEDYEYQPQKNHICCMRASYDVLKSDISDYHSYGITYVDGKDLLGI